MIKSLLMFSLFVFSLVLINDTKANSYRIQVGDILRISLPGEESIDKNFSVTRQGTIYLPEVGPISVVGLSESSLQSTVSQKLSPVFQDLLNLHVYVYKRQLLVNVLGYVEKPGEVVLPAEASIQAALHVAGGLRTGAQLDKLQIRRGDQLIRFNYKGYLDNGDASLLPQLQSLDTLFIPASPKIGNVEVEFDPAKIADAGDASDTNHAIKVFGEVNSPGSFSYSESINLVDLLMRAGGVTRYAGVEQIRVMSNGKPELFDLKAYLDTGDLTLLPAIFPGATIFIPRQEEAVKSGANTIYVMGEVFHPGMVRQNLWIFWPMLEDQHAMPSLVKFAY